MNNMIREARFLSEWTNVYIDEDEFIEDFMNDDYF